MRWRRRRAVNDAALTNGQDQSSARWAWGAWGDRGFVATLWVIAGGYAVFLLLLLATAAWRVEAGSIAAFFERPELRRAMLLSIASVTFSATVATGLAVPIGYLLGRRGFRGRGWVEALVDVPIALPPLVIGLLLLIFFRSPAGAWIERAVGPITYEVPAIVLAQTTIGTAFAARVMRDVFREIPPRAEQIAWTLGCTRRQAFTRVSLPEARRGVVAAWTLAWARSLGEFGPLLVFAGATRMKTEVLSTSVFLELNVGNIQGALVASLLIVTLAAAALVASRWIGGSR